MEIVTAMRSLAFVELRRLSETIAHQRATLAAVEQSIDELLAHHPQPLQSAQARDVLLAIGSERGFCGDFNAQVIATLKQGNGQYQRVLAVGARLSLALTEEGIAHEAVDGPTFNDEVPRVLQRVAAILRNGDKEGIPASGLLVLHHDRDAALGCVRLLPSPAPPRQPAPVGVLQLQLAPRVLFHALMDQYLLGRLSAALLASLHAENQRRLEHTGAAIDRLERELDSVRHQRRRARQEAITEEIEILLLGAM